MIVSVDFVSRLHFERLASRPGVAVISIGDPDQATPGALEQYPAHLRLHFLDIEPDDCWKMGLGWDKLFTLEHAVQAAEFLRGLHAEPAQFCLVVHCEAGVSRSAAVALAAQAYAGGVSLRQDASYANPHVVGLMREALQVDIEIPAMASSPEALNSEPLW